MVDSQSERCVSSYLIDWLLVIQLTHVLIERSACVERRESQSNSGTVRLCVTLHHVVRGTIGVAPDPNEALA